MAMWHNTIDGFKMELERKSVDTENGVQFIIQFKVMNGSAVLFRWKTYKSCHNFERDFSDTLTWFRSEDNFLYLLGLLDRFIFIGKNAKALTRQKTREEMIES